MDRLRECSGSLFIEVTVAEVFQHLLFYTQDFSAQYIDDFDKLPFDIDSLRQQLERLAVASAPWQGSLLLIPPLPKSRLITSSSKRSSWTCDRCIAGMTR